MASLTVTLKEAVTLNNRDQGATTRLTISSVNEVVKRIVTATTTESGLIGFLSSLSNVGVTANKVGYLAGIVDDGDVRYMRITNLDSSNHITLTFRDEDNTEFAVLLDKGQTFIYNGDIAGGVVDTMHAGGSALTVSLNDLVNVTALADTAACDLEIFVAST